MTEENNIKSFPKTAFFSAEEKFNCLMVTALAVGQIQD